MTNIKFIFGNSYPVYLIKEGSEEVEACYGGKQGINHVFLVKKGGKKLMYRTSKIKEVNDTIHIDSFGEKPTKGLIKKIERKAEL